MANKYFLTCQGQLRRSPALDIRGRIQTFPDRVITKYTFTFGITR